MSGFDCEFVIMFSVPYGTLAYDYGPAYPWEFGNLAGSRTVYFCEFFYLEYLEVSYSLDLLFEYFIFISYPDFEPHWYREPYSL